MRPFKIIISELNEFESSEKFSENENLQGEFPKQIKIDSEINKNYLTNCDSDKGIGRWWKTNENIQVTVKMKILMTANDKKTW